MQITKRNVELRVDDSLMRVYVAAPSSPGVYPGIIFYSDIYQLGGAMIRLTNYLAGYGYVVAAPEIFHRTEPVGLVIEPDDIGRMREHVNMLMHSYASFNYLPFFLYISCICILLSKILCFTSIFLISIE